MVKKKVIKSNIEIIDGNFAYLCAYSDALAASYVDKALEDETLFLKGMTKKHVDDNWDIARYSISSTIQFFIEELLDEDGKVKLERIDAIIKQMKSLEK